MTLIYCSIIKNNLKNYMYSILAIWKQNTITYIGVFACIYLKDIHQTVNSGYSWRMSLKRVKGHSLFISHIFVLTAHLIIRICYLS